MAVADLHCVWPNFQYAGAEEFAIYFKELETDDFEPKLDYMVSNYRCRACGQNWYVEHVPEAELWPAFAMKTESGSLARGSEIVETQKDFLTVLAHRGFSGEQCLIENCTGLALNGRWVCCRHFSMY